MREMIADLGGDDRITMMLLYLRKNGGDLERESSEGGRENVGRAVHAVPNAQQTREERMIS
jgi:hypothetical protein